MSKVLTFVRKEIVLVLSGIIAIISMFFVPLSKDYIKYIDFNVLILLFCLMLVVAGLSANNIFHVLSERLIAKARSLKILTLSLVLLTFFSAMFITNDVALITFVPFAIMTLSSVPNTLIYVIAIQTIAANLGSMLTPIGNPQNLFLYSFYNMDTIDFLKITFPVVIIGLVFVVVLSLIVKGKPLSVRYFEHSKIDNRKNVIIFIALFIVCLLTVFNVIPYIVSFLIILASVLVIDRNLLKMVDYGLLLTFVFFFVFVGNLANIPAFSQWISTVIVGKELIFAALIPQFISNLPAAVMMAEFTDNAPAVIIGVNIGGLGTLIASLASVISFKLYAKTENAKMVRYIFTFSGISISLLIILLVISNFLLLGSGKIG